MTVVGDALGGGGDSLEGEEVEADLEGDDLDDDKLFEEPAAAGFCDEEVDGAGSFEGDVGGGFC